MAKEIKEAKIYYPSGELYGIYTKKEQGKDFVKLAKQLVKKRKDVHGENWKLEIGGKKEDVDEGDENEKGDEDDKGEEKALEEMNTKELKVVAKAKGLKVKRGMKDADIIELIEAGDEDSDEE